MPDPIRFEWLMDAHVQVFRPVQIGDTPNGNQQAVPGGADWQRTRADGITELEVTYAIQLDDSTYIKVSNRGFVDRQTPEDNRYFRTAIQFVAPNGKHQWLNEAIFLCKAQRHATRANTVQVDVYKLV